MLKTTIRLGIVILALGSAATSSASVADWLYQSTIDLTEFGGSANAPFKIHFTFQEANQSSNVNADIIIGSESVSATNGLIDNLGDSVNLIFANNGFGTNFSGTILGQSLMDIQVTYFATGYNPGLNDIALAFNNAGTGRNSFYALSPDVLFVSTYTKYLNGTFSNPPPSAFGPYANYSIVAQNGYVPSGTLPNYGVPEPAAWALMIAGFGVVGVAMRKRQAVAA